VPVEVCSPKHSVSLTVRSWRPVADLLASTCKAIAASCLSNPLPLHQTGAADAAEILARLHRTMIDPLQFAPCFV
jgi:hypothetical protein